MAGGIEQRLMARKHGVGAAVHMLSIAAMFKSSSSSHVWYVNDATNMKPFCLMHMNASANVMHMMQHAEAPQAKGTTGTRWQKNDQSQVDGGGGAGDAPPG